MTDSKGNMLSNTAHEYAECSAKGLCDRKSGTCECFTGYEGSACQRTTCPNDCNGHGTCESIREVGTRRRGNGNVEESGWSRPAALAPDPAHVSLLCVALRALRHRRLQSPARVLCLAC